MGENTKQDFNQKGQNFKFTKKHRRLLGTDPLKRELNKNTMF